MSLWQQILWRTMISRRMLRKELRDICRTAAATILLCLQRILHTISSNLTASLCSLAKTIIKANLQTSVFATSQSQIIITWEPYISSLADICSSAVPSQVPSQLICKVNGTRTSIRHGDADIQ